LRFDQLADITGGILNRDDCGDRTFRGVSIDSRLIEPDELFIALDGKRVDGHDYVEEAVSNGASGVLARVDRASAWSETPAAPVVSVPDTHDAMIRLAAEYLERVSARRVAITASNGKTTTKEYTYSLLQAVQKNVYRTPGNFNNLIGIPLSLFDMPESSEVVVLELGVSMRGEMRELAALVKPDIAAVLNVGPTHLEFLETVEAVAQEKLKIIRDAAPGVPLVVNSDDPVLMHAVKELGRKFITFGLNDDADFLPTSIEVNDQGTVVNINGDRFNLPIFGRYQVYNLLAGYAIAGTMGYTFKNVDTLGIKFSTVPMRGETVTLRDVSFIVDCYNANPVSVREGLASFASLPGEGRRIAVIGDMLELGKTAVEHHQAIGRELARYDFDLQIGVGPLSKQITDGAIK